jgi:hypothetical protein
MLQEGSAKLEAWTEQQQQAKAKAEQKGQVKRFKKRRSA